MIPASSAIEKIVLKKITPNKQEKKQIEQVIKNLKDRVTTEIKKTNIPITVELVGSTAKDTYISSSVDIDLFLVFPSDTPRRILQEAGLAIGRAVLEQQEECFAEHPYVRGIYQEYKTELVPCYRIQTAHQKISAVDRTPLHTRYVKNHLKESQKKEVRLIKQFLKGIGCYGAEAEIEGFSGYLCEILILKYGTFQDLLEHAERWTYGEQLTLQQDTYPEFTTPLVFIDPVDEERNVASALSKEKFELFITACHEYIKKPRLTFFFPIAPTPWPLERIRKNLKGKELLGIILPKPEIISENLYPQIRKALRAVQELCERYDFTILDTAYHVNTENVLLILQPKTKKLPQQIQHTGPPTSLKKNADEFIHKWATHPRTRKKPYEKDKRLYVEIDREYTDIKKLLEEQVGTLSLGKNIDLVISKGFPVVNKKKLLLDKYRLFWTMYLDQKKPWER